MKVETALKLAGSVRKLAEVLGVTTQAVYKLRKKPDLAANHEKVVRKKLRRVS
jgi:hypothetical protein